RLGRQTPAREAYEKSLALEPGDLTTQMNYGLALVQLDQAQRAKKVRLAALARHDRSPGAWAVLGAAHKALGDDKQAIAAFRRALAIEPNFVPALFQLAVMLELAWELPEAEAMVQRMLAL